MWDNLKFVVGASCGLIKLQISDKPLHTGDTDFVSDFVSDYFAFCTYAEGTFRLHFSYFVLNCQKFLLDIYCGYCWKYTA